MITACIHAWLAHRHVTVNGRSFNADWHDEEQKIQGYESNLPWRKTGSMCGPRYDRYCGVTIRTITGFYLITNYM